MLKNLTQAQKDRIPEFREKWEKIGLCTDRLDFLGAKGCVQDCYDSAGENHHPQLFFHAHGPLQLASFYAILVEYEKLGPLKGAHKQAKKKGKQTEESEFHTLILKHVPELFEQMASQGMDMRNLDVAVHRLLCMTGEEIKQVMQTALNSVVFGSQEVWLSFYDFFDQVCNVAEAATRRPLIQMAQVSGWWIPCEQAVIFCNRPDQIHIDERMRLSNEDGPAISWPNDKKLYVVGGVSIPAHVIESPEKITVQEIRGEENAEVKRIMREKFGTVRFLKEMNCDILDAVMVPRLAWEPNGNQLVLVLYRDQEGHKWLHGPDGSTHRTYAMRVPETCSSALEAYESLIGTKFENSLGRS